MHWRYCSLALSLVWAPCLLEWDSSEAEFCTFGDYCHEIGSFAFNTLRPRQNGRRFADDLFKCIFLNENARISLEISLKSVPKVQINNIQALVRAMAWRRSGDKPLSEPIMVSLLVHICVTRPQWVKVLHWPIKRQSFEKMQTEYNRVHSLYDMVIFLGVLTTDSKLEQLERLHSEDTPPPPPPHPRRRLMITIESYWIPRQKKTKSKIEI